ncbi:MAG TPA: helix-turn-helix domain-containing protein [Vicinamibacterales bacterium]
MLVRMEVREQLLDAALRVYAEFGTRGATTRRIAQAAGVNEVTLFRHFGSKDALIREALGSGGPIVQAALDTKLPDKPVDPEAELTTFCRQLYQVLVGARSIIRRCMGEFGEHTDTNQAVYRTPVLIANDLQLYLQRLRAAGLASGDWQPRAAAAMLMGVLFSDAMGRDCMPERFPSSEKDALKQYVALFLRAIGVRTRHTQKPARR